MVDLDLRGLFLGQVFARLEEVHRVRRTLVFFYIFGHSLIFCRA